MKTFRFVSILLITAFVLAACGGMSQPKTYTIGVINLSAGLDSVLDGFKAGMAQAGYVEGQNVTYIYSGAAANIQALDPIVQGMKEQKVDLVFAISTAAAVRGKKDLEGTDIPMVFGPVVDPVGAGLVADLLKPGGNVTGVQIGNTTPKRLQWLLAVAPNTKLIYVVNNPSDASSVSALAALTNAANTLGVKLEVRNASTPEEISAAFGTIPEGVDSIFMLPSGTLTSHASEYVKTANEYKLPLSDPTSSTVQAGALIAFGQDNIALGKQAGRIAAQILGGTKPADLPVETADSFLTINLKTAQAIGLNIPDAVISQANTVYR